MVERARQCLWVLEKSLSDECRRGTGSTNHDFVLATAEERGHRSYLPLGYSCGRAVLNRRNCSAEGANYYRRNDPRWRLAVALTNRKLHIARSCSRMVGARQWNDL
jgi:hypothetical protein